MLMSGKIAGPTSFETFWLHRGELRGPPSSECYRRIYCMACDCKSNLQFLFFSSRYEHEMKSTNVSRLNGAYLLAACFICVLIIEYLLPVSTPKAYRYC